MHRWAYGSLGPGRLSRKVGRRLGRGGLSDVGVSRVYGRSTWRRFATSRERKGTALAQEEGVVLSVRGEAQQSVAPDAVVLAGGISVWADSKPDALTTAASALDRLTAELSELGGSALAVSSERSALTWSAFSATTHAERDHDKSTGRHELTGRVLATVGVGVAVRDFALLDGLGRIFARHEGFNVRQVTWLVDDDNPGWSRARNEAIQAALRKGRDYAAALGVSLVRVEQVADTGLLGGSGDSPRLPQKFSAFAAAGVSYGSEDVDTPSLDPVPQDLSAVIEARFRTTPAALPA